ncbi:MAG: M24 family metallopeptidase, partial [Clostridiales bacterium]|nr:M24 family metallopeptidase [Clostridiales bacterium]
MQIIDRIKAFRARMEEENMAAVIVPTADSHASEYLADYFKTRQWLSGFTGSAGTLVMGREEAALFTDGRYFIQAQKQLEGSGIELMRMGVAGVPSVEEYVCRLVKPGESCGVDFSVISSHFAADMSDMLAGREIALRDTGDWFKDLWADRPAMPKDPVYLLEEKYTGMSVSEKLARIRDVMAKAGADMHLSNVLDDIAWTLNVRGNDVHCTPVVMSYLLVGKESAIWFVDAQKVSEDVQEKLFAQGVYLREYGEIESALEGIEPGTSVMIDGKKLTANLCAALADTSIIQHENPAFRIKAIKNDVELENLRLAHVKDGLAVTRLMYWLKKNAGKIDMDELSVDEKLLALRAQQEHFISPSFDTICAYRANAAMMHYRATEASHAKIEAKDLLLIDSGAQYLEGTTDITRTFAMGEVAQEQKEHFTAVLCGMLNLQSAKFLHGCTGIGLDILARGPMWDMGIDYRCGTGHGVGYLLSVHEGPNAFRWYKSPTRNEDTVLEAGM